MGVRDRNEYTEHSMGPMELDVALAKSMGWTDADIERAVQAMHLIVRGTFMSIDYRTGCACEHCSARDAVTEHLPCGACGRTLKDRHSPRVKVGD